MVKVSADERYYLSLDIVKGIAILLVIADHCGIHLLPFFDYFEVPSFFIVSGMLFSPAKSWHSFLIKKIKRLVVPYFVYATAFVAVVSILNAPEYYGDVTTLLSYFKKTVFLILYPANYPLWFLKALFWGVFLFRIVWMFFNNLSKWWLAVAAITMAFIVVMVNENIVHPVNEIVDMTGFLHGLYALPLIAFGYLIRPLFDKCVSAEIPQYSRAIFAVVITTVAIMVVHGEIAMHALNIGKSSWSFYPFTLLVFAAVLSVVFMVEPFVKLMGRVGRLSLEIFCVHAIIILLLRDIGIYDKYIIFVKAAIGSIILATAINFQRTCHK